VTEIEPGIGIGALLCITRLNEDQSIAEECLVNSKMILDNAGIPSLSAKWEQKFGKTSKTS
jgi:predicted enzyme involved in methoxymalonyl-ACP biosynthesis